MKTRATIVSLFIFLYGIALVRPAFPLVEYYVKLDVYLQQCVNKNRPELHCNGQCILMQKLKAVNAETETPVPPAPVKINLQDYPIGFIETDNIRTTFRMVHKSGDSLYLHSSPNEYVAKIFHPPSV